MSEYNSPIDYGQAHPGGFFTKYPPITGRISRNPYDWGYGGINLYPRPFNSWFQQINSGNNYLGPFARRLDTGKSGRIKMSMDGYIGFVEQCWYDFPRGNNDTDGSGNKYPENREFWEQADKCEANVYNLMTTGPNYVDVEVAISNTRASDGTSSDPQTLSVGAIYGGGLWGLIVAVAGILANRAGGQPGDTSDCGENDVSGHPPFIPEDGGIGFLTGNGLGNIGWLIGDPDNDNEWGWAEAYLGAGFQDLTEAEKDEIRNNLAAYANEPAFTDLDKNWWNNLFNSQKDKLDDLLDKLKDAVDQKLTELADDAAARTAFLDKVHGFFDDVSNAGGLMTKGWWIANLNRALDGKEYTRTTFAGDITTVTADWGDESKGDHATAANPYPFRPSNRIQKHWASKMTTLLDGSPGGAGEGWEAFLPYGGDNGFAWRVTHLNRGDSGPDSLPYIDPITNEFVWRESYGFNRGDSVAAGDAWVTWVDENLGYDPDPVTGHTQVGDSFGAWLDMSPATLGFAPLIVPVVLLEVGGRIVKKSKGENIDIATNLDGYETTYFETRISAKNLKEANPTMYNWLLQNADHKGTTMQPVID
tara:strand:- start:2800 stop:4566 length:1767 start_codon:yes stop_codon:yes gene_type:complete